MAAALPFRSTNDLTGGNSDGSFEIYLFDATTIMFTQLTATTGNHTDEPTISADGTRIAFFSNQDLTGGNADGNFEIFLFDTTSMTITQVTQTTGGDNLFHSINADGTRIAFDSFSDITGGNADLNTEIFLFDASMPTFTQMTATTGGGNFSPAMNADGTRIAFVSERNITGGNPDANFEIFLFDTNTMTFTQVTHTSGGENLSPSLNADGTRIAFRSDRDLTLSNPDGNFEIFLFDTQTQTFTQVTDTVGGDNNAPALSADGARIAFSSNADVTGGNPDTNTEIFLADYPDGCIPPSVFEALDALKDLVAVCPFCPPDPQESLLEKIDLAIKHLQKGNDRPAADALRQFVKRMERLVESREIPAEAAQRFIVMAEVIIAELSEDRAGGATPGAGAGR
jgi:Tol biopolymer transport system component